MKCEPRTAVAQPGEARINASIFACRLEVGQDYGGSRLVRKAVDTDLDDSAVQLYPSLDPVDELPMDQFWRLVLRVELSSLMPQCETRPSEES